MEAEDFQQGWKQKWTAVEDHRRIELREHPHAANEGSRERAAGPHKSSQRAEKEGTGCIGEKACAWINAGVGRRGGA